MYYNVYYHVYYLNRIYLILFDIIWWHEVISTLDWIPLDSWTIQRTFQTLRARPQLSSGIDHLNDSGAFTGVAFTGVISCYSICISICFHLRHVSKIFKGTIGTPFASLECWAASRTGRTSNAAFAVVATSSMSPAKRPQLPRRPARRPPCQAKRFLNHRQQFLLPWIL